MIRVDIGDIVIKQKVKGAIKNKLKTYYLKPSFENISKIGDPREIINAYTILLDNKHLELVKRAGLAPDAFLINKIKEHIKKQEETAERIIASCCDTLPPNLPLESKITIAIALMRHGVNGMAKIRVSQRNQTHKKLTAFDVNDYIMSARINLGMTINEAKTLTMTEFILLMAAKYPDNDGLTKDEYDAVNADYEKRKRARLAKEKRA